MKIGLFIAPLALSLLASACTPAARLDAPAGFAELGGQKAYDYRATNAQGIVVAVRRESNDPRANVDFWAGAIDARLRREGYAAEPAPAVTTANGVSGKQLRYSRAEADRRTYRYWVTVFATNEHVYLVEAGGDQEMFDPAKPAVERAITSLRAD